MMIRKMVMMVMTMIMMVVVMIKVNNTDKKNSESNMLVRSDDNFPGGITITELVSHYNYRTSFETDM